MEILFWWNLCLYPRKGNGSPLQYSCLENPTHGGAWWAAVHRVSKSCTRLSDFTFTFHFHALKKEMATHSSVLAWRIPGTGEPGGLSSMGSHRVGHDWSDLAAAAGFYPLSIFNWVIGLFLTYLLAFLMEFWLWDFCLLCVCVLSCLVMSGSLRSHRL